VVSGGWDTDSNGATAGSVTGLLAGSPAALPAAWTAPLDNRLASTVAGFDGIGFDALARRTAAVAFLPPPAPAPPECRAPADGPASPTGARPAVTLALPAAHPTPPAHRAPAPGDFEEGT
jgi:hypothetical protein